MSRESGGAPPYPDSVLMNERGRYNCEFAFEKQRECYSDQQHRPVFYLSTEKVYKLRVINMGGWATFNFSVDGHTLEAIEVDGIDVKHPVPVDTAFISAGQRYSFLLIKDKDARFARYTIRANLRKDYLFRRPGYKNINPFPDAIIPSVTGVIEYSRRDTPRGRLRLFTLFPFFTLYLFFPEVLPKYESFHYQDGDSPEPYKASRRMLKDRDLVPFNGQEAPHHFDQEHVLTISFVDDKNGFHRGVFNGLPFILPTGKPLLARVLDGTPFPRYFTFSLIPSCNFFDKCKPKHFLGTRPPYQQILERLFKS